MRYLAFIICATPRSGSTLLCDLLTASGTGQPQSYFRSEDIGSWAALWGIGASAAATDARFNRAYLAAMTRVGTAGTGMFGLRLMWPSVGEATTRLAAALDTHGADFAQLVRQHFGATLFIHLSLLDTSAQAVSLVRAEQTGLWHVAADGSERQRTSPGQPAIFDADHIRRVREQLMSEDRQWSRFFADRNIQPLRLTYEALAADPHAILANVLGALGRDPRIAAGVEVRTARMADATSAHWAARLDPSETANAGVTERRGGC